MRAPWRTGVSFLLSGCAWAFAQGLTLDSLIRLGKGSNPDLLVSREEGEAAASDTLGSATFKNPVLGIEAGYNVADPGKPKAGARLSKEFQPGLTRNQIGVSRAALAAKRQTGKSRELETVMEIRAAYFDWQVLNRKYALQAEVEKRWDALSRIATAKVKEGRLSQVDEAQARLNRADARQKEMVIRAEMESVEKRLDFLTGMGPGPDSIAPYPIETLPEIPSLDTLLAWAVARNADLRLLDLEIETQRLQVGLERSLGNPTVTVSLGYDRETDGNNVVGGGVELPIPISNRNQAGLAKSRAQLRLSESRRAVSETRLRSEIADLHSRLRGLAERYRSYQDEIRSLSGKQLELSEKGFLQGLVGIFELSRVQEEFLSRELESLDILQSFYDLWNRLGKAAGGKPW